ISKDLLFRGGVAAIADAPDRVEETLADPVSPRARLAWTAYLESAIKAVASLSVSVPNFNEVILSGRLARVVGDELTRRLRIAIAGVSVHVLDGFAAVAKQAAQGAALIADGLAGGQWTSLVETMGIREASGSVLDHLYVISAADARSRLGIQPH